MKQLLPALLGLAGLLLASFCGLAQQSALPGPPIIYDPLPSTHPCMPYGIQTDPPRAVNRQYPIRRNTFNWYSGAAYGGRGYNINWTVPLNPSIFMPWEQSDNPRLTHILGQNDTPTQGWQLIKRDLGYNDAGVALGAIKNPYVIIYNRYTGVLRVFVATGEIAPGYNFAHIKLSFNPDAARKAGTLNRATGLGIALEDTAPGGGLNFLSITKYQNSFGKWFYADFPMEYDPCTCLFDSKFLVEINLVDVLDVQLRGLSKGTLMTTNAATGSSFESPDAQGSTFSFKKVLGTLEAGQKTYSTIDGFAGGLNKIIQNQASVATTSTATATSTAAAAAANAATAANAAAKLSAVSSLQAALKASSFLKAGLSAVPYIGAAVSMLDFFLGGGKEAPAAAPNQPLALQPMTIEFSTETKGTITANRNYISPTFNNPGTPAPATPAALEEYPYYNEALGVFSLVRAPVLNLYTDVSVVELSTGTDFITTTNRSMRFNDLLHFTVNPASGMRVQDMQAALVMVGSTDARFPTNGNGGGASFSEYEGVMMVPGATAADSSVRRHTFRTPYVNAACLTSSVYSFGDISYSHNTGPVDNPIQFGRLYVKLLVNLTRIVPSATAQNVLVVLKYPVRINNVSAWPATTPVCASPNDVPIPAPLAELTAFCASTVYDNATLLRPAGPAAGTKPTTSTLRRPDALAAYPNPAADQVTLRYTVEQPGVVTAEIRDVLGRTVAQMVNRADHPAGTFDATISTAQLPAGVYHCTLITPTNRQTTRLVIAR